MKITEAKYKKVRKLVDVRISDEKYGCDGCNNEIKFEQNDVGSLRASVFSNSNETKQLDYCSWKCFAKSIKLIKTDYFISLPFVNFDTQKVGLRAKDFLNILK